MLLIIICGKINNYTLKSPEKSPLFQLFNFQPVRSPDKPSISPCERSKLPWGTFGICSLQTAQQWHNKFTYRESCKELKNRFYFIGNNLWIPFVCIFITQTEFVRSILILILLLVPHPRPRYCPLPLHMRRS